MLYHRRAGIAGEVVNREPFRTKGSASSLSQTNLLSRLREFAGGVILSVCRTFVLSRPGKLMYSGHAQTAMTSTDLRFQSLPRP